MNPDALFNAEGRLRMRRVGFGILGSFVVLAIAVTVIFLATSDWPAGAAIGMGVFVAFWTSPLVGSVAGNGYHELRTEAEEHAEKAHDRADADLATDELGTAA